jgi:hypothetical protein
MFEPAAVPRSLDESWDDTAREFIHLVTIKRGRHRETHMYVNDLVRDLDGAHEWLWHPSATLALSYEWHVAPWPLACPAQGYLQSASVVCLHQLSFGVTTSVSGDEAERHEHNVEAY